MKKLCTAVAAATLLSVGVSTLANDEMHGKEMMSAMDTNGDGMLSRDEYMSYHQKKWDRMQKNANGMVDMKAMERMHEDKMKSEASKPSPSSSY